MGGAPFLMRTREERWGGRQRRKAAKQEADPQQGSNTARAAGLTQHAAQQLQQLLVGVRARDGALDLHPHEVGGDAQHEAHLGAVVHLQGHLGVGWGVGVGGESIGEEWGMAVRLFEGWQFALAGAVLSCSGSRFLGSLGRSKCSTKDRARLPPPPPTCVLSAPRRRMQGGTGGLPPAPASSAV